MAVDLSEFVDSLRREVTPPGSDLFSDVSDDVFTGYLSDAFWEARLDGFVASWTCDVDGVVTPITGDKEFPRELVGLLVLYGGIKILRNRIMNLNQRFSAKAGPVEYTTENSASVLSELLRQLDARRKDLLEEVEATPTFYYDAYLIRGHSPSVYWGDYLAGLAN